MGRVRLASLAATALVAAVGVAACGSSSKSSSASSSSTSSSAGSSASATATSGGGKTPYVLGVIASESGPLASTIGGFGPTIQAWGEYTNAHGGIAGHPVKVVVVDDAGNPGTALTGVKRMVQQDHIIALINASGSETVYAAYTKAQKIPVVGGLDGSPLYESNGNYFSQGPPPSTVSTVLLQVAKQKGLTKLAIPYCAEVAACSEAAKVTAGLAKGMGMSVVSSPSISSSAADYTAQCLAAKKAGATALEISAATQQQINVGQSCSKQGLSVPLLVGNIELGNLFLKSPKVNAISVMPVFPFTDASTTATKAFQGAMSQYLAKDKNSDAFGAECASAWASAALFGAAAKDGDMGDSPSPAGVFKGLYALKDETLGGLSAPLNYVQGANPNVKNKCAFVMDAGGGKFTEPQGMKPVCAA